MPLWIKNYFSYNFYLECERVKAVYISLSVSGIKVKEVIKKKNSYVLTFL